MPNTQNRSDFLVNKKNLAQAQIKDSKIDVEALTLGQLLLKVNSFSFTANNITYAALGDSMGYWRFFPTTLDMGIIPVWGFADVVASQCDDIQVGERLYGYYPMASHVIVEPKHIATGGFVDGTVHRAKLPIIYNQYSRCSHDPMYTKESEALQMLLRPLFTTSFLLDDFFASNQFFNASNILLTCASSKTALGMAFLLKHNRQQRQQNYDIIGLTSAANVAFVESLGCYDRVLSYQEINTLENLPASAIVDFAGNSDLLLQLHTQLAKTLQYSCRVGASHWQQTGGALKDLPGPQPKMFFAPTQGKKCVEEWGQKVFQDRLAKGWLEFITFVQHWMQVEYISGPKAVQQAYGEVLAGRNNPQTGYIFSLWNED